MAEMKKTLVPSTERLSVVMPVHNALPHLDAAVHSILGQTYRDFEFVILDDASTDGSSARLVEWAGKDHRIKLVRSDRNLGPVASSNLVVKQSSGSIVARMDADDIAHPDRLRRQIELLHAHPEAGLIGTLCEVIDGNGRKLRDLETWRLLRKTSMAPFPHGSFMYRRHLYDEVGGYRQGCEFWEDQDLVWRIARLADILVIPAALFMVRHSSTSTRVASDPDRVEHAVDLMYRSTSRLRSGESYDDLITSNSRRDRVDPRVFISLGSLRLWSGETPHQLGRLLRKSDLRLDFKSAAALVWTAWAAASPGTLRAFLGLLVRVRSAFARRVIRSDEPLKWTPAHAASAPARSEQALTAQQS
ncbi:MAG TPA: glycosyltransferase family A protein [Sphingomicrobium sp.]|nr:glycosyltransferase family A protein [Sphingomicrobium sp.]